MRSKERLMTKNQTQEIDDANIISTYTTNQNERIDAKIKLGVPEAEAQTERRSQNREVLNKDLQPHK